MDASEANHGTGTGGGRYRFGGIVVDTVAHTLCRDGMPMAVEPKSFAVLLVLLRRANELVTHVELLDQVWGHRHVTPGVLTRAIAQLRAALDDPAHRPRYIQTQHALGYRFIGVLEAEPVAEAAHAGEAEWRLAKPAAAPPSPPLAADRPARPASGSPSRSYVGAERRWTQRFWYWQWLAFGVLLLAAWVWLDHRDAPGRRLKPSVAVMPFSNLDSDRDNDYFSQGLTMEMHDALAAVDGLKVAAPVSTAVVARQGGDVKALGALLGVSTVLDASVRREGQRVRINARLLDCASGYTLWSRSYDRQLADVFDTQVEIASEVVHSLLGALPPRPDNLARRLTPTRDAAAFDAYLRGLRQLLQPSSGTDARGAVDFFNEALLADHGFARAQAGICRAEVTGFADRHDAAAFARARDSCERAQAMDPGLSEVNLALGELHHAQGELGKAVEYYTRARSDPASLPAAHVGIAIVHAEQGRDAQALDYFNRALALRPGDARIHAQIGYRHFLAGRLPEAIASYRRAVELQPDDVLLWSYLGGVYLTAGQVPDAERALARSIAIKPSYTALTNLGEIKYLSGRYAEAVELQQRSVQLDPSDHTAWGNLAQAQLAAPATAGLAGEAFREAAERAQRYVEIRTDDAKTLAALGWYRANLGQPEQARQLIQRSEALGAEPGEVALYNAQTFVRLGQFEQARERIAAARAAGIVTQRIDGNAVLRGAIAAAGVADPGKPQESAPSSRDGPTPGG